MTIALSKLYGKSIYSSQSKLIGKAHDFILNLHDGMVVRITTESLKPKSPEHARELIMRKSVLYKNVLAAKDAIIVKTEA